jgi:L-aminopeptidase/D-esterase-like protein
LRGCEGQDEQILPDGGPSDGLNVGAGMGATCHGLSLAIDSSSYQSYVQDRTTQGLAQIHINPQAPCFSR